ncbi:hypothetical protein LX32DRAFT_657050 [Colletotrichum zoysiae]|uniref:Chromo domain-containing protein n=1 Tax=Colletotrichum zoysiae TaxID=1216348 RepID=A0AAD9LV52_9PEZI|nr:hypothetical protein LX32DRAFT_657050 [Colletotrichum zoysiae]
MYALDPTLNCVIAYNFRKLLRPCVKPAPLAFGALGMLQITLASCGVCVDIELPGGQQPSKCSRGTIDIRLLAVQWTEATQLRIDQDMEYLMKCCTCLYAMKDESYDIFTTEPQDGKLVDDHRPSPLLDVSQAMASKPIVLSPNDDDHPFKVEVINDHKRRNEGVILLRVLWVGFPHSAVTWENENDLCHDALSAVLGYWACPRYPIKAPMTAIPNTCSAINGVSGVRRIGLIDRQIKNRNNEPPPEFDSNGVTTDAHPPPTLSKPLKAELMKVSKNAPLSLFTMPIGSNP